MHWQWLRTGESHEGTARLMTGTRVGAFFINLIHSVNSDSLIHYQCICTLKTMRTVQHTSTVWKTADQPSSSRSCKVSPGSHSPKIHICCLWRWVLLFRRPHLPDVRHKSDLRSPEISPFSPGGIGMASLQSERKNVASGSRRKCQRR